MDSQLTARYAADEAVYRLYHLCRRAAERWGVPLAAVAAVVVALGVSASLAVSRIDANTAAIGGAWLTVASAHAVASLGAVPQGTVAPGTAGH